MTTSQPFYHLRPNKFIDRYLFLRVLSCLRKQFDIEKYRYIGFGSFMFDDFKLMHNYLSISDMISIENDPTICKRAEFNKPYKCIKIEKMTSSAFIENMSIEKNSIIWLDYTSPAEIGEQLADFSDLLRKMEKNDIVRITLNANPCAFNGDEKEPSKMHSARLKALTQKIGQYIPSNITQNDMTASKFPSFLLGCLKHAVSDIYPCLSPYQKKFLFPLFSTVYQDGQQMFTFTAILLEADSNEDKEAQERQIKEQMQACDLCDIVKCDWDECCQINVPALTPKEVMALNNLLPDETAQKCITDTMPFFSVKTSELNELIANYIKYYKYYPNFHHVNF